MMESRFSDVAENIKAIRYNIEEAALKAGRSPSDVTLMAVTKTVPAKTVNMAIAEGVRLLGENRAQELTAKYGEYEREGVSVHFIGALQTNKVRQIIDKVDMIQSLDSIRLAGEIDRQAGVSGRICDVLIEVNIGGEQSKSGVLSERVMDFSAEIREFQHIRLRGLMTIPPFCDNMVNSEKYFDALHKLFVDMKGKNGDNSNINILSMGMSGDYPLAVKHGANIVRVGTALFGGRLYGGVDR